MLQFGHEPWIARSAYRRSSSSQLDDNEPDPNGDVTLVVSPPPHPQKYNANSTVTAVESNTATESTVASEPTAAVNDSKIPKSRFRVSSKHLVLASAYFGKMLSPQWREGRELSANGTMELEVPDTDPDVFLIILNIIHSRKKRVPRAVSLEKLTELAVQTDYFQFQEALEPYPSVWVKELEKDIPAKYSDDLVKWICISWVFNYDGIFTSVTKIAQLQATGEIDTLDMPIPAAIYSTIDATRMAALSKIFTALRERRDEIAGAKIVCSYECDSLLLGALLKSLKTNGLSINATPPYSGLAIERVVECISNFKTPYTNCGRCRVLGLYVKPEMDEAVSSLRGLFLT